MTDRNDPCWCDSGKKYKRCHEDADREARRNPDWRTIYHETGHAIVYHAIGRRVVRIRIGNFELPADHPDNPFSQSIAVRGGVDAEPRLDEEIAAQLSAGKPPSDTQREWLCGEAIVRVSGAICEVACRGDHEQAHAAASGDFAVLESIAATLKRPPSFSADAQKAAQKILGALRHSVEQLAQRLAANPGEWGEESIQSALAQLGASCGSHRYIVEELLSAS